MSYYSVPPPPPPPTSSSSVDNRNVYEDLDNLSLPPPPPPPPPPPFLPIDSSISLQQPPQHQKFGPNIKTGGSYCWNTNTNITNRQRQIKIPTNQFPLPPPTAESELQLYSSSSLSSTPNDANNNNNNFKNNEPKEIIYTNLQDKFNKVLEAVIKQSNDPNKNRFDSTTRANSFSNSFYSNVNNPLDNNNQQQHHYRTKTQNIYDTIFEPNNNKICSTTTLKQSLPPSPPLEPSISFQKSNWSSNSDYNNRNQSSFNKALSDIANQISKQQKQQSPIYANLNLSNNPNLNSNNNKPLPNLKNYLRFNRSSTNKQQEEEEVDHLTDLLVKSMENSDEPDFFGMCNKCGEKVVGEGNGCTAMEKVFHIQCFTCNVCNKELRGKPFYAMENKPHCEECYLNTLEKCSVCEKPILDRILRATGKPYHPKCFICIVCQKCLDGIPFTVDESNQIHCIDCFHNKFAPRCSVCNEPIVPEPGKTETVRVVALDKSFHVSCYKCEDCDLLLSSEVEGRGCYPLDDHILCRGCNAKRVQAITAK